MRKSITILFIIAFISGCAVTSEKYRYQHRIDNYYKLMNNEEKDYFREGDYTRFAASFSKRLQSDKKLSNEYTIVQQYEAITTFDEKQTAHFFREIILRELNKNNFFIFMNYLDTKSQIDFTKISNFMDDFNKIYQNNRDFKNFIENLKTEYKLYGYSNEQIFGFFRQISFPAVSRNELYHTLEVLKDFQGVEDFKKGNIAAAAQKIDSGIKKQIVEDQKFSELKKRAGLEKLDTSAFLDVYYNVILKEMDPYAVERTLALF